MGLSQAYKHFHGLLSKELIAFKSINSSVKENLGQWLELLQDLLVFNAQQEGSSSSEGGDPDGNVLVLHALFEDCVERVLVGHQLLVRQMALSLLFENIHGELL